MEYKYINFIYILLLKTLLSNGSRRFIVNSYTLHPPNHIQTVRHKVNQTYIDESLKNVIKKDFEEATKNMNISLKNNEKKLNENII